ncbi:phosphatidylinositol 4,5-bisphosphate 5-phosphatase A-like isoform X1 [Lutzomyia longipalpis]|uniref:phosphatidylinositol 4,5-bisphosphate 5-phosphatase A-like isoform X1 n=1 Tax=Lutzomyia longipalpis TaxID=7200 RepID=UPI00248343FC|nr:phosphatidylinositol 4,5-bisphosphate 5-phosphatase A-like isoform X1 [Lutzomyia longipalpis]
MCDSSWNANIHIVTWNVSTRYPEGVALHSLLGLNTNPEHDGDLPDFYVIGLQEVNAQVQNQVIGLFKEDPWTNKFKEMLKERNFVVVKTEQMQGLLLMIFTRKKHLLHLREIEAEYTRTGLGGIWGNKGAVSIRMNIYGCTAVFLNSHLAAHDHMLDERVEDYHKILQEHKYHIKSRETIFNHDYVFWFGDLNFRLTGEATTSPEDIRAEVKKDNLGELMQKDQLLLVMNQERAFSELTERLPAFPPTFKFEPGTQEYDMKRRPAWCDRILYRVSDRKYNNVKLIAKQNSYKSHPAFSISDHKPVSSEFNIKVVRKPAETPLIAPDFDPDAIFNNFDALDGQIFSDPSEKMVEFAPIDTWTIGEEYTVKYTLPEGLDDAGSDWIGVYNADFGSVEEYQAYEYTSRCKEEQRRTFSLTFPDTLHLPEDPAQTYVLLYFQSTGTRGITGLAGMSEPFHVEHRARSPSVSSVD